MNIIKLVCVVFALWALFGVASAANASEFDTGDKMLDKCLEDINDGAWSNGMRASECQFHFDLPSPFLIKCVFLIDDQDALTVKACKLYLPTVVVRDWRDYQGYNLANINE